MTGRKFLRTQFSVNHVNRAELKRVFLSLALVFLILLFTVTIIAPEVQADDFKFRGTVVNMGADGYGWFQIDVDEILVDPGGRLRQHVEKVGLVVVYFGLERVGPQVDPSITTGDRVEVYCGIMFIDYPPPPSGFWVWAEYHYIMKIGVSGPADLVVYRCWVSPANPKQEDSVTFYAVIANVGGSDASNFRLETYLDGSLYDSGSLSLSAGQDLQVWSEIPWRAEDGSHSVRWVINPDRSVEESNYGNNEASCSFFVSPRTVTATVTVTKTSTRTTTQRTVTTVTTTRRAMITRTTDTTVLRTVTANPTTVTQTLTGLITSTIYSPTVTVTVTSTARMISTPVLWLLLSTFAMIGAVIQLPSERLRRLSSKLNALFQLPELARKIIKRHIRKALFAVSLISLIILSISPQATQQTYASTVTTTRTVTVTEWTTLTQSLTSTRYITSTTTETSMFTRTNTGFTTITPTITMSFDRRSTTTVYIPTTISVTSTIQAGQCPYIILEEGETFVKIRLCAEKVRQWRENPSDAFGDALGIARKIYAETLGRAVLQAVGDFTRDPKEVGNELLSFLLDLPYQDVDTLETLVEALSEAVVDAATALAKQITVDIPFGAFLLWVAVQSPWNRTNPDGSMDATIDWLLKTMSTFFEKFAETVFKFLSSELAKRLSPATQSANYVGLSEPGSTLSIHVYDQAGRHVGMKGEKLEIEIPGAWFRSFGKSTLIKLPIEVKDFKTVVDAELAETEHETYFVGAAKVSETVSATGKVEEISRGTKNTHSVDATTKTVYLDTPKWTVFVLEYYPYMILTFVVAVIGLFFIWRRSRKIVLHRDYSQTCAHCGAQIPRGQVTSYCIQCGKPIRKQ